MQKHEILSILDKHLEDGFDYDVLLAIVPSGFPGLKREDFYELLSKDPARLEKLARENEWGMTETFTLSEGYVSLPFVHLIIHLFANGMQAKDLEELMQVGALIYWTSDENDVKLHPIK